MTRDPARIFRERGLLLLERILGQCDRKPESSSRGCCDRYYWCYRLHDLPNARFQEAALYFALAAPHMHETMRPAICEIARAAGRFWSETRNRDGSVNEIYPHEHSFCATSMSAAAVAEAMTRMNAGEEIDWERTGAWLSANDNAEVANQMAGACLALARIGVLTGETCLADTAAEKFERIRERQLPSGCYGEYGGEDIGYATITLALLAGYHRICGSEAVLKSMQACASYLESVVDPKGLYDWTSTSRRTQFLYPSGLAYLSSDVLNRLLNGLERNVAISPLWMDDRYSIQLAADYLVAAEYLETSA